MVITRNIGRLGNNMFQIATSIGYAKKYGYQWAADSGRGVSEPYSSIHQVFPGLPKGEPYGGQRYHEHPHGHCKLHGRSYDLCHFDYHPIPDMGPNLSLTGFFQSWRYFENAQEEVRQTFKLPHYESKDVNDCVSIHVRLTDYVVHSGSFPPITTGYLRPAIEHFVRTGYERFLVFSDDISGVRGILDGLDLPVDISYSEGHNEREDLIRMASCAHHIIANSTYSWWAAYLGRNPERQVVTPSHKRGNWFGYEAGVKQDVVDLLPPHWHQITFR